MRSLFDRYCFYDFYSSIIAKFLWHVSMSGKNKALISPIEYPGLSGKNMT